MLEVNRKNPPPLYRPEYSFFKPGQIVRSKRRYVGQGEHFRLDIRQNLFLKKIRTSRVCVALKKIWSYCTLINIKLR